MLHAFVTFPSFVLFRYRVKWLAFAAVQHLDWGDKPPQNYIFGGHLPSKELFFFSLPINISGSRSPSPKPQFKLVTNSVRFWPEPPSLRKQNLASDRPSRNFMEECLQFKKKMKKKINRWRGQQWGKWLGEMTSKISLTYQALTSLRGSVSSKKTENSVCLRGTTSLVLQEEALARLS